MRRVVEYTPPPKYPIVIRLVATRYEIEYEYDRPTLLSDREAKVSRLRANGKKYPEIMEEIGCSLTTVRHDYFVASTKIRRAATRTLRMVGILIESEYYNVVLVALFWCAIRGNCRDDLLYPVIEDQLNIKEDLANETLNLAIQFCMSHQNGAVLSKVMGKELYTPPDLEEFLKALMDIANGFLFQEKPTEFGKSAISKL